MAMIQVVLDSLYRWFVNSLKFNNLYRTYIGHKQSIMATVVGAHKVTTNAVKVAITTFPP